jgi:hypothetical protein
MSDALLMSPITGFHEQILLLRLRGFEFIQLPAQDPMIDHQTRDGVNGRKRLRRVNHLTPRIMELKPVAEEVPKMIGSRCHEACGGHVRFGTHPLRTIVVTVNLGVRVWEEGEVCKVYVQWSALLLQGANFPRYRREDCQRSRRSFHPW